MLIYIARRFLQLIPVLLGVTVLVFFMLHLTPGDAAQLILGENATEEQLVAMRAQLGLDQPIYVQYFRSLTNLLQGDLGTSVRTGRPVAQEIFEIRFGNTFQLAVLGVMASTFLGLLAGIISATRKGKFSDMAIMVLALFGLSIPNFFLGIVLMNFFSVQLQILPVAGWGGLAMVLPVVTLGVSGMTIVARMTRASLLDVLGQDYIRTAYAKGVSDRVVIFKHALKNALIPVITVVGLQFGALLTGAIITETVFAINGLGRLLVESIRMRDFPLVQGSVLVAAFLFVTVNFFVDIAYKMVNKRMDIG